MAKEKRVVHTSAPPEPGPCPVCGLPRIVTSRDGTTEIGCRAHTMVPRLVAMLDSAHAVLLARGATDAAARINEILEEIHA